MTPLDDLPARTTFSDAAEARGFRLQIADRRDGKTAMRLVSQRTGKCYLTLQAADRDSAERTAETPLAVAMAGVDERFESIARKLEETLRLGARKLDSLDGRKRKRRLFRA